MRVLKFLGIQPNIKMYYQASDYLVTACVHGYSMASA